MYVHHYCCGVIGAVDFCTAYGQAQDDRLDCGIIFCQSHFRFCT